MGVGTHRQHEAPRLRSSRRAGEDTSTDARSRNRLHGEPASPAPRRCCTADHAPDAGSRTATRIRRAPHFDGHRRRLRCSNREPRRRGTRNDWRRRDQSVAGAKRPTPLTTAHWCQHLGGGPDRAPGCLLVDGSCRSPSAGRVNRSRRQVASCLAALRSPATSRRPQWTRPPGCALPISINHQSPTGHQPQGAPP